MKTNKETHPSILIVEDTEIIMYLLKAFIDKTMPGATVIEAVDGNEGVEFYKRHDPDIIILNIQLPGKNGYDVAREIRKFERDNDIAGKPIIAHTARDIKGEKEKCLKAGMNDFMSKPVDKERLAFMLNKYLKPEDDQQDLLEETDKHFIAKQVHFDKQGFLDRLDGNMQQYRELMSMAVPHLNEYFELLKKAMQNKNFNDIEIAAHKLKGAALFLHFKILGKIAEKIEYDKEHDIDRTKKLFDQLEEEFEVVKRVVGDER